MKCFQWANEVNYQVNYLFLCSNGHNLAMCKLIIALGGAKLAIFMHGFGILIVNLINI